MKAAANSLIVTGVFAFFGGLAFWLVPHIPGCATVPVTGPDPTPSIADVQNIDKAVAGDIGTRADRIDASASGIASKASAMKTQVFGPALYDIRTNTAGLRVDQGQLQSTQAQLTQASTDVTSLQKTNQTLTDQVTKLKAANAAALHNLLMILIVLCVVGIGASGALVYIGNLTVAIPLAIGCAGTLVTAIIVSSYSVWLAIAGGVLVLAGIGYVCYQVFVQKKALSQVISTSEAAKMVMTDHARMFTFGNGPVTGQAHVLQDESTQRLVKQIRSKVVTAPSVQPVPMSH
jgi:hypothetical protein